MIRTIFTALRLCAVPIAVAMAGPAVAATCPQDLPAYRPAPLEFPAGASYVMPDGRIRIVGYNDMAEMLEGLGALFTAAHPGFRFDLVLKGTRTAPAPLTDGTSLFAPMGAEIEDAPLTAYRAAHGRDPLEFKVAHDSLNPAALSSPTGVFVHKDNPLGSLTLDEIAAIFATGPAPRTKWGQVGVRQGWREQPIHPVGFSDETAIGQFLRRHKFAGRPFVPEYDGKPKSRDVMEAVARDKLAIGLANLNHATPGVKALGIAAQPGGPVFHGTEEGIRSGRYPLDRHLLIYVRQSADGAIDPVAREWLNLIVSCEGQQVIAAGRLGYIPLNSAELAAERAKLPK